jgi:branched-chain amino acid transport system permease protein
VEEFVQYLLLGVVVGAVYSLIALGLVLVYRTSGVINFAHGHLMTIGAILIWSFAAQGGFPLWASIIAGLGCAALLGLLVERLTIKPMMGQAILPIIIMTLGLTMALESLAGLIWGTHTQGYSTSYLPTGTFWFGNIQLPQLQVYSLLITVVIFGGLLFYLRRSKWGLGMQAVADDVQCSQSVGVKATSTLALAWALAVVAGGVAGYILGNLGGININFTPVFAYKALVVMLLAGLQSLEGIMIAGPIIGVVEFVGGGYLEPLIGGGSLSDFLPFLVALIILSIRPQGLFGWKVIERI